MGDTARPLPAPPHEASTAQKISWVLYDWANSGYGLIIIGVPFTDYFIEQLLPSQPGLGTTADGAALTGLSLLGSLVPASTVMALMTSLSMLLMALGAPLLGAIADVRGWTKRLLVGHTLAGSLLAMSMVLLRPGNWAGAAVLYVASNYCFGMAFTFYNAFLPKLTAPQRQGRLSGWGFAMGYLGGLIAMTATIWMSKRLGLGFAGLWWLTFSLPAFFLLPEFPPQNTALRGPALLSEGFRRLRHTFAHLRQYRMLFLFLLAFLLYNDGIETVIALSPSFGKEVLGMARTELIRMFLAVQLIAFVGAVAFGYLADRVGNKPVILINLLIWLLAAVLAFFVRTGWQFTLLGFLIGIVLGGVQASSRALMGLLAPPAIHNEAFGFFSISGKFASIFGPLAYGALAWGFGPRTGVFAVLPFLLAGFLVLLQVQEPRTASSAVTKSDGVADSA